jgi:hypothetical protein
MIAVSNRWTPGSTLTYRGIPPLPPLVPASKKLTADSGTGLAEYVPVLVYRTHSVGASLGYLMTG